MRRRGWGLNGGVCVTSSVISGAVRQRNVACDACRRGVVGGVHSHIRGGGISQSCGGGCSRHRAVIGCGWRHLREVGGRAAASTSSSMRIGFGRTLSHTRGGSGISGSRGAFSSIHVHIRRRGCGQRLGGGYGRRCGVVSSTPAYVRKEGRYVLGSGRGGRGRNKIRANLYANAGRGNRSRRAAGGGTHRCIRGGGSGQGCGGGCGRHLGVVGCGRGHHREMGS